MSLILTDNQHYKNIANAIREKSGKETLIVPVEMAEEIKSLPNNPLKLLYTEGAEITAEDWGSANITPFNGNYNQLGTKFYQAKCKKISFPSTQTSFIGFVSNPNLEEWHGGENMIAEGANNINSSDAFKECTNLKKIWLGENCLPFANYAFYHCNNLNEVHYKGTIDKWAEAARNINIERANPFGYSGGGAFYLGDSTEPLTVINLTTATVITQGTFYNFDYIEKAILGETVASIANKAFAGCTSLETLILKGDIVKTLSNVAAFSGTPIANGTGTIYIQPLAVDEATLVAEYKAATNWSAYANIKPFSEYIE